MRLPAWLRRTPAQSEREALPLKPKSPIDLYEASGKSLSDAPEFTQNLLREAERSHRRRTRESDPAMPSGPLHAHEVTPADAALMRMLAGASFGPDASVTLPSGRVVTGSEMARWVAQQ